MYRLLAGVAMSILVGGCAASSGGPHAHHAGHAAAATASHGKVRWFSLAEGRDLAWVQEKPMLVEFYVPEGCPRCAMMDEKVYGNPEISGLINERFVPVRINLTGTLTREEAELGRRFDYQYECLLLFLDSEGNIIEKAGGGRMCFADFIEPQWFMEYLTHAAEVAAAK